jgi:Transposase
MGLTLLTSRPGRTTASWLREFQELYTNITNKAAKGRKGSLVAIIAGTASEIIIAILNRIPESKRKKVTEITLDIAGSMNNIAKYCFPKAQLATDRFHVQKLAIEALQEKSPGFVFDPPPPGRTVPYPTHRISGKKLLQTKKAVPFGNGFRFKSGIDLLSHPLWGSTISASGLNFSVRNGKRWTSLL